MSKQLEIKATKNGTDYVSLNFLNAGKRVGGFNASISTVQDLADQGFLGQLGIDAVAQYSNEVSPETIFQDSIKRQKATMERKLAKLEADMRARMNK